MRLSALAISASRCSFTSFLLRRPRSMFWRTVFHGNKAKCWNTTARSGPGLLTGLAFTLTVPDVGCSKPATIRRQVVLPQPDGPTMATNSLSAISRLMSWSTFTLALFAPNILFTLSNRIEPTTCPLGLEAASTANQRLAVTQQDIDQHSCNPDGDHSRHHCRCRDIGLSLHHHEADAGGCNNQFRSDQGLPAEPCGNPKTGDDRGNGSRQQDFHNGAQVTGAKHPRGFDQMRIDETGSAIGIDQARWKGSGKDDHHRAANSRAEPECGERYPGDRSDEAKSFEDRRHDVIEQPEPAHQQSQGKTDKRREQHAEQVALKAGREMLRQRGAGKGGGQKLNE